MSDPAGATNGAEHLVDFARAEWRAAGSVAIADAYKWLHQATQGAEHAIGDARAAQAWLEREWAGLAPVAYDEPLVVPLRPDGQVVRLHLRPYRAAGGDPARLLDAFLASAARVRPDHAAFLAAWQALGIALRDDPPGELTPTAWADLDAVTAAAGYPAVHHSPGYRAAHRPAYRVLDAADAAPLIALLPPTGSHRSSPRRHPRTTPQRTS